MNSVQNNSIGLILLSRESGIQNDRGTLGQVKCLYLNALENSVTIVIVSQALKS